MVIRAFPGDKRKSRGYYATEKGAFERAMQVWDGGMAKFPAQRACVRLYDDEGTLAPTLVVYDKFRELAKVLRPALF